MLLSCQSSQILRKGKGGGHRLPQIKR